MTEKIIIGYTEEYRDRHWVKCRYGYTPRHCGNWQLRNGRWVWTGCYATRILDQDGELHNYCMRDNLPCDAHWIEQTTNTT